MAFDTVIDKAQLEGAITASANAIRGKTGSTEMIPWDAGTGFADAISAIETGGGGEIDVSVLGNAMPLDVKAGVIFSSENGIAQVGTHVCTGDASGKPIILKVEKVTSDTYDGSTDYTGEEFILLDIYPKSNGTVNVTYGGLTKTITDTSGADEPESQQVYFGTYHGVSDSVETPASGSVIIDGDYRAFAASLFEKTDKEEDYCDCILEIVDFGTMDYIPENAFGMALTGGCKKLKYINLPYNLKSIGDGAFSECLYLEYLAIPHGIKEIPMAMTARCNRLRDIIIPSTVTTIRDGAFSVSKLAFVAIPASVEIIEDEAFDGISTLKYVRMLGTTPPTIGADIVGNPPKAMFEGFIVPSGCGETYKTWEGWSVYADYILEEGA